MRKRHLLATVAVAVALAGGGGAAVAVAEPTGPDDELLTQKLEALADVTGAAVVAEVRGGDEVWTDAAGTRVDGGDVEAEPTDLVKIGSLTKSMITVVLLQLAEEGELSLDDSVQELAPDVLPYQDTITVRQLLNHTSGVPDYFTDIYPSLAEGTPDDIDENRLDEYEPQQIIDLATKRPLDFAPGAEYRYSNTGYFTLGLLIEKLTGDTVEAETAERVLEPAGMDSTSLPETDPTIDGDHLNAYFEAGEDFGEERIDTTELSPTQFWAAGVALSNPADMNRLYRALFDGTLLSDGQLDEMRRFTEQSGGAYGLGLQSVDIRCDAIPGGKAMGHTGGALGHSTFSFHSADARSQISITFASDPQQLPAGPTGKLTKALEDLLITGLCGDIGSGYAPKDIDLDPVSDSLAAKP